MLLLRRPNKSLLCSAVWLCALCLSAAAEYRGQVLFNAEALPGATVTVKQDGKQFSTVTNRQGLFEFADLPDGEWKVEIEMRGFFKLVGKAQVGLSAPPGQWEMKMLGLEQMLAEAERAKSVESATSEKPPLQPIPKPAETAPGEAPPPIDENAEKAADGFVINGSVNNAATSRFSLSPAFGNRRPGTKGLYNGGIGAILDNSALDARPYSLSGGQTPKSAYSRITMLATIGGPVRIPHFLQNGPNFFVAYQWTRSADASTAAGMVPTALERSGDLSGLLNAQGQPVAIYNPATGLLMTGSIPVSAQAAALLNLYPMPSPSGNSRYNYQAEVLNNAHADAMQARLNKSLGRREQVYGGFGFRSMRAGSVNLLDFLDTTNTLGIDANANWQHRFNHQITALFGYHFTRQRTEVRPEFEHARNISGQAGIGGNDQDPADWGPPALAFSSGLFPLSDAESAFNRNRTEAASVNISMMRRKHNLIFGADFRRQEFNEYQQANPRGRFTFTGGATHAPGSTSTATGSDIADFLFGIPDTSAIAFGNPDKYFRQSVYDAYFTDDWRLRPEFSINAGMRWDYGAPMTELFGRLVNLDIVPGFAAATPVVGKNPIGSLTGTKYPGSLLRPDHRGFEPRIGISWRPIPASTLVVRAGYGIYDDTSVYLSAAESMAQQAPLSTSLSVANSTACPLTLANGFRNCAGTTADTFAVDPNLRVGYAQTWSLSAQRDMPWAMVMIATYMGTRGVHGMQEFLPNTYPIGAANPCPACAVGFVYRTSGGNSTRQAGQMQLRRRLRSGFTATADYTFAKALDDDAQVGAQGHTSVAGGEQSSGNPAIAQNWRDLRAEHALSTFDQRHLVKMQLQYTVGMGIHGGTLLSGWRGRALKEWTGMAQIQAGTGRPEAPMFLATVPGTGVTGTIRPSLTGASIYAASTLGYHLNASAFSQPAAGAWGNARRDAITGPNQFSLDAALSRSFTLRKTLNLDLRIDTTNLMNHAVFTGWNTTVNSATFGLPASVNAMRSLQATGRLRF